MIETDSKGFVTIEGDLPGETTSILIGVHGNERAPIVAMERKFAEIQRRVKRGTVIIGYGNLIGVMNGTRDSEGDHGTNLNRMFLLEEDGELSSDERNSYEFERAQVVKEYIGKGGVLLDAHGTLAEQTTPLVICEPNGYDLAGFLKVREVVSGFDKWEPGGTDYWMNRTGRIGICLEAGYNLSEESVRRAEDGFESILIARGHIDGVLKPVRQRRWEVFEVCVTQTEDFRYAEKFDDFREVPKNWLMGWDGGNPITTKRKAAVLFAEYYPGIQKVGEEAYLLMKRVRSPKLTPAA